MSRAYRPSGHPGSKTPFILLGVLWLGLGVVALTWIAGRAASTLSGHGWDNGPGLGSDYFSYLVRGQWDSAWPEVPSVLVAVVLLAFAAAAAVPAVWVWRRFAARRTAPGDPIRSLAQPRDLLSLTGAEVRKRAQRLRPSLKWMGTAVPLNEAGLFLGNQHRSNLQLAASYEDVLLAIMAPRTGKTTAIVGPAVLDAPGPVVATSNRSDLWQLTARPRAARGRVWVFDPQSIAYCPQEWYWNPLSGINTVEEAHRLAMHFVHGIKTEKTDFWSSAAHGLLTGLFLAAAVSHGTIRDVYSWLNDPTNPTPKMWLERGGFPDLATELAGRQNIAHETRDGVYETARTAAQCLRDPAIAAWVTPSSGRSSFDPTAFVESTDTLHLLSKDGAGAAAPLVAALTDRVIRAGVRCAETRGGRLDPPLLLALDEAANVCRIADLPDLYSHVGSRGIVPITSLQSYRQGVRAWGAEGMAALWGAATVKLIGAGTDDPQLAEDISKLTGDHDVDVASYSRGHKDSVSESVSTRRQRILPADAVRALPKGTALLLATGIRPALIDLVPWYERPDAPRIEEGNTSAKNELTGRADRTTRGAL